MPPCQIGLRSFGLLYVNISKHISISVLFFIIQCPIFCVFLLDFENNCHGGGVLARFFSPGVGISHYLCARGWGIRPFKKFPGRGWSGLELTDTL